MPIQLFLQARRVPLTICQRILCNNTASNNLNTGLSLRHPILDWIAAMLHRLDQCCKERRIAMDVERGINK